MDTVPAVLKDEVRDLIANGWTPPDRVLGQYRHLLKPFNDAKGYITTETLDEHDRKTIVALLAVFDHFGLPLPEPKREPVIVTKDTVVL